MIKQKGSLVNKSEKLLFAGSDQEVLELLQCLVPVRNAVLDYLVHFRICLIKPVRLENRVPAEILVSPAIYDFPVCYALEQFHLLLGPLAISESSDSLGTFVLEFI